MQKLVLGGRVGGLQDAEEVDNPWVYMFNYRFRDGADKQCVVGGPWFEDWHQTLIDVDESGWERRGDMLDTRG